MLIMQQLSWLINGDVLLLCLFLCRGEEDPEEDPEADPGVIVLFASAHDVDVVLQWPAVGNLSPPLQRGKRHYLPIGLNITFSLSLPPPHSSPSISPV